MTAVTVLANSNVVVTVNNSFTDGMDLRTENTSGMTQLDNFIYTATNSTSTNVTLLIAATGQLADGSSWDAFTGTGTIQRVENVFTNVTHLASQTLNIFAEGGAVPDQTVSTNGVLTTDQYYSRVIAGLPYTARLSPMHIDVVNSSTISYGKTKNPYKVHFRVNNSGTWNYGSDSNAIFAVSVREPDLTAGSPVPFFSGDRGPIEMDSPASTNPEFWITSEEPLPLEMLSIVIFTDIKEYE
jgi:hypothetical protein